MLAIACALAGCSALFPIKDELVKSTRAYNQALRWGEPGQAVLLADKSVRPEFADSIPALEKVRVVDYRLVSMEVDEKKKSAEVRMEYDYYVPNGVTVKTVSDLQKWTYLDKEGWRITSPPPAFK